MDFSPFNNNNNNGFNVFNHHNDDNEQKFGEPQQAQQPVFNNVQQQEQMRSQQQEHNNAVENNKEAEIEELRKNLTGEDGNKPKKRGRTKGVPISAEKQSKPDIDRVTVERIIKIHDAIKETGDDSILDFLKTASGTFANSKESGLIVQLLNPQVRLATQKNITKQIEIIKMLEDPFSAALTIGSLPDSDKRAAWNIVASVYPDTIGVKYADPKAKNRLPQHITGGDKALVKIIYESFLEAKNNGYEEKLNKLSGFLNNL